MHLDLKFKKVNHKLKLLNHIKGKDCALLPYLSDESLHTIGEFLYNVIQQRIPLSKNEARKVQKILLKNKPFFSKLVDQKTKNPLILYPCKQDTKDKSNSVPDDLKNTVEFESILIQ